MNKKPIFLNVLIVFGLIIVVLTQASFVYSNFKSEQSSMMFHEHIVSESVSGAFSVHSADIDGDGDMDIVATASGEDEIKWWENKGNHNFVEHLVIASFDAWAVYAIDLDKDNHTDILGGASNHGDVVWIENDGDESFTWNAAHYIDKTFGGVRSIYADDIDKDGDIDVLGAAQLNNDISWWENDGYQNFERHIISDSFHGAFSVYSTDVDGDGHVDVLAAANDGQKFSWWENDGSQNFSEHVLKSDMGSATSIFASDVDSDGDMDILGAVREPGIIFWWENDGNQFFTEHTLKSLDGLCSVHAADMDGDGDVDIIGAANDDGNIFLWENDGDENFREILVSTMGFLSANYVFPSDLNGDGKMDIISAGFASDTVAYWTLFVGSDFVYLPLIVNGQKEQPTNPPSTPTLNDISNDDGDGSYQISWNAVVDASTYTLEEADNSAFTGATEIYNSNGTSHSVSGKLIGTYYYRVLAGNAAGDSGWSSTKSVVVSNDQPTNPPSTPTLNNISNDDGDGSYQISWNAVADASTYTLEEADNSAFTGAIEIYNGSGTSHSVSGKLNGTYYYRVLAGNADGESGWSSTKSVVVNVLPPDCPQVGTWSGTTDQGRPISFEVELSPTCQIKADTLQISKRDSCGYTSTTTFQSSYLISSFHFDTGTSTSRVIGDFSSSSTASGTYYFSMMHPTQPGRTCTVSGTWNASSD